MSRFLQRANIFCPTPLLLLATTPHSLSVPPDADADDGGGGGEDEDDADFNDSHLLSMIQGVFLTGTPPKNSKFKKVNLG